MELEVGGLRTRAAAGDDAMNKLAQSKEQLSQAKRHLKQRDDDVRRAVSRADKAEQELQIVEEEARQASSKVNQLENETRKLHKQLSDIQKSNGSTGGLGFQQGTSQRELLDEIEASRIEIDRLRTKLTQAGSGSGGVTSSSSLSMSQHKHNEELKALTLEYEGAKREIRRLQDRLSRSGGNNKELSELREENKKLKEELSAFDMDFFEEIEDLKYKYAEAVRKLQRYE